ncbi:hypothetical protein ACFSKW_26905 [Nonomuraea mangrovi]|uniref:Transcriptional regulator n=1 Tax=Nonomuraea mangrovi TaxID=2316207 RepID=A0ABW4T1L0_9ACTN
MDRRGFLITSTSALAAIAAQWATAPQALSATTGRRVGHQVADLFDQRLDALRHLDDHVGSWQAYDAATAELRLITSTLKDASYTGQVGHRLYGCAAEASRLAGWCAYDDGHHAAAERHFVTSLRASASAGDTTLGASTLAFWANVRYSSGDPQGALDLIDGALASSGRITSQRVLAMLYARQARAHSKAGESAAAYRAIDTALNAYGHAGPPDEDLAAMYWITAGELHQVAASAALSLGEPRRALAHFDLAVHGHDPYNAAKEARGTAIYLARHAEAYLALDELDAAVETAERALDLMGGVDSARGTSALDELRSGLLHHKDVPVVQSFLVMTA